MMQHKNLFLHKFTRNAGKGDKENIFIFVH